MADHVQWGYGNNAYNQPIVEINDSPSPQKQYGGKAVVQQIVIPLKEFDEIVRDYINNRREAFLAQGLVEGVLFDDDISGF